MANSKSLLRHIYPPDANAEAEVDIIACMTLILRTNHFVPQRHRVLVTASSGSGISSPTESAHSECFCTGSIPAPSSARPLLPSMERRRTRRTIYDLLNDCSLLEPSVAGKGRSSSVEHLSEAFWVGRSPVYPPRPTCNDFLLP